MRTTADIATQQDEGISKTAPHLPSDLPVDCVASMTVKELICRHWPLALASCILLFAIAWLLVLTVGQNDGRVIYALDDAYIHMAMAKNLVKHGVWGVTPYGFTSCASSILWPVLVALSYAVFGVNELAPLVLNSLSALLVLLVADWILRFFKLSPAARFLSLMAVAFLTPLPTLVFGGMEHTLQTAITLAGVFIGARYLSEGEAGGQRGDYVRLLILAPFVTAIRYEGLFLIAVMGMLFLLRRRWRQGVTMGMAGSLPIVIYGIISLLHGWSFLPNSVLMKSGLSGVTSPRSVISNFLTGLLVNLLTGLGLVALVLFLVLLFFIALEKGRRVWETRQVMATLFVGAALLHLGLARMGWFYRYEAYLMGLGTLVVCCQLKGLSFASVSMGEEKTLRLRALEAAGVLMLLLASWILLLRAGWGLTQIPGATANIYDQQYQMGLFIERYYTGSTVALNDIGAVNFLADIHCLDMAGLAYPVVAAGRRKGRLSPQEINSIARPPATRVALVYDSWFGNGRDLPAGWRKMGTWTIPSTVVAGSEVISIYAVDPSEGARLIASLREYSSKLPRDIRQDGLYTEAGDGPPD